MSDTKPQTQASQRTPSRINAQNTIPRHIIFKLQKIKDKEKMLKEARGKKHLTYREAKVRITPSIMQARRE